MQHNEKNSKRAREEKVQQPDAGGGAVVAAVYKSPKINVVISRPEHDCNTIHCAGRSFHFWVNLFWIGTKQTREERKTLFFCYHAKPSRLNEQNGRLIQLQSRLMLMNMFLIYR